ncbi:MAG: 6-phosphogluconolactonase/glucosamine-6-phosphate isomerase/deaminase [Acidimicrobiales bacterium]|jgi:6-phosphogluconolactonase/glucosamine-6-phosphate isomerase/deaminase
MKINTSKKPHIEVAKALSKALKNHAHSDVLLLLAGGSALQVLDELSLDSVDEYTTIMMMDERFSSNPLENNFIQMTGHAFYQRAKANGASFISSVPLDSESNEKFAVRVQNKLNLFYTEHPKVTTIALFGIGPDGHTAAIFPMPMEDFIDTYAQGFLYVPVKYFKNTFPKRSSITPQFIHRYIDEAYVYATGESKLSVLKSLHEPCELHQMPANIHHRIDSKLFTDQPVGKNQTNNNLLTTALLVCAMFSLFTFIKVGDTENLATVLKAPINITGGCSEDGKNRKTVIVNEINEISSTQYTQDDHTYIFSEENCQ